MNTTPTSHGLVTTGLAATAIALVLTNITFLIATATTDSLLLTPPNSDTQEELPLYAVIFFTALGGLAGIALAAAIGRLQSQPRTVFVVICLIVLVVYGTYSYNAAATATTGIWLNVLHIVAAIPIVGSLSLKLPVQRRQTAKTTNQPS